MQKLKLTALLLISIAALSGCSKPESATTIEASTQSQPIASQSPQEDIYTMEYRLCGEKCEANTSQIVSWGKPTEVGIIYYDGFFNDNTTKPIVSMDKRKITGTYFVVRSKGILPAMDKPLKEERFVPIETYANILVEAANPPKPAKYGRVEIVSVKKLANPAPGRESAIAMDTLKTKQRDYFMVKPDAIQGYFTYSLERPEIKPQQVDPITWQEGQPPQIIPVRAW